MEQEETPRVGGVCTAGERKLTCARLDFSEEFLHNLIGDLQELRFFDVFCEVHERRACMPLHSWHLQAHEKHTGKKRYRHTHSFIHTYVNYAYRADTYRDLKTRYKEDEDEVEEHIHMDTHALIERSAASQTCARRDGLLHLLSREERSLERLDSSLCDFSMVTVLNGPWKLENLALRLKKTTGCTMHACMHTYPCTLGKRLPRHPSER